MEYNNGHSERLDEIQKDVHFMRESLSSSINRLAECIQSLTFEISGMSTKLEYFIKYQVDSAEKIYTAQTKAAELARRDFMKLISVFFVLIFALTFGLKEIKELLRGLLHVGY